MFRKVRYDEVSTLFTKLSIDLQRSGQKHYAAMCMLSAGKCEELNRTPLHASYFYLNAGRVFVQTSTNEKQIKYFTAEEFVVEAMDAFKNSIEIYESHAEYSMCATLCFELANMLYTLEKFEESGSYFMKSFAYASPTYQFQDPEIYEETKMSNSGVMSMNSGVSVGGGGSSGSAGTGGASAIHWAQRHFMLFSENHTTTQLQSLRCAVLSYLRTSDYEIVTQVLQLQLTLLTLQYQTVTQSMTAAAARITTLASSTSATSSSTGSGLSVSGTSSSSSYGQSMDMIGRQRSGSITLNMQQSATCGTNQPPQNRLGSPGTLNSMATLLFTERINVHLTLLLVLLIQKRKKESRECMQELLTAFSTELEQSNTTSFFKDNVLPLIEELYDACMTDRVTHVVFIIEQQILHHSLDDKQIELLNDLRHVYENPLFVI